MLYKTCGPLLLLALTLLLSPNPARAGQWMVTPSGTETDTTTQNGVTVSTPHDYSIIKAWGGAPGPMPFTVNSLGTTNQAGSKLASPAVSDSTGTITFTLTWVPAPGKTLATDPPPTTPVTLSETDEADWWANALLISGQSPSLVSASGSSASDGNGDTELDTGNNFTVIYSGKSTGRCLIQRNGSSGTITLSPCTLTAHATMGPSGAPVTGMGQYMTRSNFYVTISPDSRMLTISCPTIETPHNYYKGTVDAQHPTGQWPHLRDPGGSMVADSVATFSTADNAGGGAWKSYATFIANTPGFTNPTYGWSSDFNPVDMIGVDLTKQSVAGAWFLYSADKLPSVKDVRLNVQDGPNTDRAKATTDYIVSWHAPDEVVNTTPFDTECGKYSLPPARLGPVSDGQTALLLPTPPQKIDWGAAIDGTSVLATAAGQPEVSAGLAIVGAVAKTVKWETDVDAEPQVAVGGTNGSTTWGDALNDNQEIYGGGNIPNGLLSDPNGWQLCNMYIFQVVHYTDRSWYADGYNANGYDGNSQHVVFVHGIDAVYDEFQFVQYKNRDGSPIQ